MPPPSSPYPLPNADQPSHADPTGALPNVIGKDSGDGGGGGEGGGGEGGGEPRAGGAPAYGKTKSDNGGGGGGADENKVDNRDDAVVGSTKNYFDTNAMLKSQ